MVYLDLQEQFQNALTDIRLPHDGSEHEVVTKNELVDRLELVCPALIHTYRIARMSQKVHRKRRSVCEPPRCPLSIAHKHILFRVAAAAFGALGPQKAEQGQQRLAAGDFSQQPLPAVTLPSEAPLP